MLKPMILRRLAGAAYNARIALGGTAASPSIISSAPTGPHPIASLPAVALRRRGAEPLVEDEEAKIFEPVEDVAPVRDHDTFRFSRSSRRFAPSYRVARLQRAGWRPRRPQHLL